MKVKDFEFGKCDHEKSKNGTDVNMTKYISNIIYRQKYIVNKKRCLINDTNELRVGTGPGPCPGKFSVPKTESRNSLVPGIVLKS